MPRSVYFLTSRDALSEKYADRHEAYKEYWRSLGLSGYERIFVYDLATKGTSIALISEVFNGLGGERAELVCFGTFNISEKFPHSGRVHSYLGDNTFYSTPFSFLEYYELLEILSSPKQTQFLYFDDNMRPVFVPQRAEGLKQRDKIAYIQEYIVKALGDAIDLDGSKWHTRSCAPGLPDAILGMISPTCSQATDDVKGIFIFESHFEDVSQTNWWERVVT